MWDYNKSFSGHKCEQSCLSELVMSIDLLLAVLIRWSMTPRWEDPFTNTWGTWEAWEQSSLLFYWYYRVGNILKWNPDICEIFQNKDFKGLKIPNWLKILSFTLKKISQASRISVSVTLCSICVKAATAEPLLICSMTGAVYYIVFAPTVVFFYLFMVMCIIASVLQSLQVNCHEVKQRKSVVYLKLITGGLDRLKNLSKQVIFVFTLDVKTRKVSRDLVALALHLNPQTT